MTPESATNNTAASGSANSTSAFADQLIDSDGRLKPSAWRRLLILPIVSVCYWPLLGFLVPVQTPSRLTIIFLCIQTFFLMGIFVILYGCSCIWLALKLFRLLSASGKLRRLIAQSESDVRLVESLDPAVRSANDNEIKAAVRLSQLLVDDKASITTLVRMRELEKNAGARRDTSGPLGDDQPQLLIGARKQIAFMSAHVLEELHKVTAMLEHALLAILLTTPVVVSGFASTFQLIHAFNPQLFSPRPITSHFDFFYYALLVVSTVGVPEWTGVLLRIVISLGVVVGLALILGLVSTSLSLFHRRLSDL